MVRYSDLLGRPWEEMHCGDTAVEGLRRMGMADAALHVPIDQEAAAAAIKAVERTGDSPGDWVCIGYETGTAGPGDLVVTDGQGDGEYGVALVLREGLALTSTKKHGVHAPPLSRFARQVRGVFRWRARAS